MKTVVLVADYANMTADSKPNVPGIFNQISASQSPAKHPTMYIVAKT